MTHDDGSTRDQIVMNHEQHYSIRPADRARPLGWQAEGFSGSKAESLAHIEAVWTDMRPLSRRRSMEENGGHA